MATGFGGAGAGEGREQDERDARAPDVSFGLAGPLGTILVALAWALGAVMVACFVAAVAAIRHARRAPRPRSLEPHTQDRDRGGQVEPEQPPEPMERISVPPEATEEEIPARLADPDPLVRAGAIASLKSHPDAEPMLLDALRDEYPLVRREAVRALRDIGGSRAAVALVEVAGHDTSAEVREEAVAALGALVRERRPGRFSDG